MHCFKHTVIYTRICIFCCIQDETISHLEEELQKCNDLLKEKEKNKNRYSFFQLFPPQLITTMFFVQLSSKRSRGERNQTRKSIDWSEFSSSSTTAIIYSSLSTSNTWLPKIATTDKKQLQGWRGLFYFLLIILVFAVRIWYTYNSKRRLWRWERRQRTFVVAIRESRWGK